MEQIYGFLEYRCCYSNIVCDWLSCHGNLFLQITGHGDKQHNNQSDDSTDYGSEVMYISDVNKFKQSISVLPVTMVTS